MLTPPLSLAWKALERSVAKKFGARRTPLSGSNSGHTAADIIHPKFFIECKYRKRLGLVELYKKVRHQAAKEDKIPLVVLKQKAQVGEIVCMDLDYFIEYLLKSELQIKNLKVIIENMKKEQFTPVRGT